MPPEQQFALDVKHLENDIKHVSRADTLPKMLTNRLERLEYYKQKNSDSPSQAIQLEIDALELPEATQFVIKNTIWLQLIDTLVLICVKKILIQSMI